MQLFAEYHRVRNALDRIQEHRERWTAVQDAEEYLANRVNCYIEHRLACRSGRAVGPTAETWLREYRWTLGHAVRNYRNTYTELQEDIRALAT